jgi:excisionase family DNA binding protein
MHSHHPERKITIAIRNHLSAASPAQSLTLVPPRKSAQSTHTDQPAQCAEPQDLVSILASKPGAWTAEQLAALLECSTKQVYKLAKRGSLPSYRLGTLVRFDPRQTALWLKGQQTGSIAA